jgi:REP element-mobilizing transposase RayT
MSRFQKLSHVIWHCQYHIVWVPKYGSPYKSMQVEYYQRVTGIGITNKNLQVNAS